MHIFLPWARNGQQLHRSELDQRDVKRNGSSKRMPASSQWAVFNTMLYAYPVSLYTTKASAMPLSLVNPESALLWKTSSKWQCLQGTILLQLAKHHPKYQSSKSCQLLLCPARLLELLLYWTCPARLPSTLVQYPAHDLATSLKASVVRHKSPQLCAV